MLCKQSHIIILYFCWLSYCHWRETKTAKFRSSVLFFCFRFFFFWKSAITSIDTESWFVWWQSYSSALFLWPPPLRDANGKFLLGSTHSKRWLRFIIERRSNEPAPNRIPPSTDAKFLSLHPFFFYNLNWNVPYLRFQHIRDRTRCLLWTQKEWQNGKECRSC